MEALKKKFKSRRGASILLALLFLLLCMMVAASIVMAAASNAGKIKSNQEEQQKYLTLSSAVTMLTDELNKAKYVGSYTYTKTPVYAKADGSALSEEESSLVNSATGKPVNEDDETVLTDEHGYAVIHHYIHTYTQGKGTLRDKNDPDDTKVTWLDDVGPYDPPVLPLRNDLDYIFRENFEVPVNERVSNDEYDCKRLDVEDGNFNGDKLTTPREFYTLEFAVEKGDQYGSLLEDKVRMKVTLRSDGSILVEATLWEAEKGADGKVIKDASGKIANWKETKYTMEALLRPEGDYSPQELLVLTGNPKAADNTTAEIKWQLKYIFKKGAEPNESDAPETPTE